MKKLASFIKKMEEKENASSWIISYDWFKPAQEGLREAICTLGNGYLGTRGAAPESAASRIHYPGTYIAGVYNKLPTHIAGRTILNEDLVNCPNWLSLTFRIEKSDWISPSSVKILSYNQELNLRKGTLTRKIRFRDSKDRVTQVETQRIVHMGDPHRAAIRYIIIPENYKGWVVVRSALDGTVQNTGVARYGQLSSKHLRRDSLGSFGRNGIYLTVKTNQSDVMISQAAKTRIFSGDREIRPVSRILTNEKKAICQEFGIYVRQRQKYSVEKTVSTYISRDKGIKNTTTAAINSVKSARGYADLSSSHRHAWDILWRKFNLTVTGDLFSQKILRLHTFHLLQTASPHNANIDAGLPARGLHGEAYRGHVFWDEVFVMPFFNFHFPEISKALLLYRYRRINEARKYALDNGYKGAMFPWQSGSTGVEETQVIHLNPMSGKWDPDYSRIQRHVSFAIAYNIWNYWKITGDMDFMVNYGAEILLSIAQFGNSLSIYSPKDGRYHTKGLMGPDEFHEKFPGAVNPGFKDNAYTNIMIVWTLRRARDIIKLLSEENRDKLIEKLKLNEKELSRWGDITKKMNIVIDKNGIISQFDGYFKLKELDWEMYKKKYGNIKRMDRILKAEGKSPNEYKVSKQADVLMMFYLLPFLEIKDMLSNLGYRFAKNMLKKNYEYYVKRTSHGSTLSKVVHCYIANLLGKTKESWQWFSEVLKSDMHDTQGGTTREGIHAGVMGGSINIAMKAFAGLDIENDRIQINPNIPLVWHGIKQKICYRKTWLDISVTDYKITVCVHPSKPKKKAIFIDVYGKAYKLSFGKTHVISFRKPK